MPNNDPHARMQRVDKIASLLDKRWRIFSIPIGVDALLGLIPGIGDSVGVLLSSYILYEAHKIGVPLSTKIRMGWNIGVDWLIGLIPLLGDVFDIGWKANLKNAELMREHLAR